MSEVGPRDPSDEISDTNEAAAPPSGLSARLGEKLLVFGEVFSRPVSLLSREQAVWEGFGSVLGRFIGGLVLIALCIFLGTVYGFGASKISRLLKLKSDTGIDGSILVIFGLVAASAAMIFHWNDWEKKWRVLSWLLFTIIAVCTLLWRGNLYFQFAVLAGQFAIHWFIHAALRDRDRIAEAEEEVEAAKRRSVRNTNRQLQQRYRGHAGFAEEEPDDGPKSA